MSIFEPDASMVVPDISVSPSLDFMYNTIPAETSGEVASLCETRNATPLKANAMKIVMIKKRIDAILLVETPAVFPKLLLTFFPMILLCFPKLFIYNLEILYYETNIENASIIIYPV